MASIPTRTLPIFSSASSISGQTPASTTSSPGTGPRRVTACNAPPDPTAPAPPRKSSRPCKGTETPLTIHVSCLTWFGLGLGETRQRSPGQIFIGRILYGPIQQIFGGNSLNGSGETGYAPKRRRAPSPAHRPRAECRTLREGQGLALRAYPLHRRPWPIAFGKLND